MAPPKGADQKPLPRTAEKLRLPGLSLAMGNGHHVTPNLQDDANGFDQQEQVDPLQQTLGLLMEQADDPDDPEDQKMAHDMSAMLAGIIKSRQQKSEKKQQQLLQELEARMLQEAQAFEAAVASEQKRVNTSVTSTINAGKKKLADKFQALEELTAKFNKDLDVAWNEYSAVYQKLDDTKQAASAQLEKMRGSHKRKLAELQGTLNGMVEETEQKLAKLSKRSGNAQNLQGMLKQLMTAGE